MIAAEIVECTGDAAFAARPDAGIIAWNKAAERLLGYSDREVLGRPCFGVLCGRDVFGNRYCSGHCTLVRMAQKREAIGRFEIQYRHKIGTPIQVSVSIVVVPNGSPSGVDLVHLLHSRLAEPAIERRDPAWDLRRGGKPPARDPGTFYLTPRETEVLRLLAEGFGTRAIAGQLTISVATTRNHIQNILTRLEVHNRLQAVSLGRRVGLI